jgi:hypothetical protein
MRNKWYPNGQAEYMTANRFAELGLSKENIGERDPVFGLGGAAPVEEEEQEPQQPTVTIKSVTVCSRTSKDPVVGSADRTTQPARARELLEAHLPPTLTFQRSPISIPAAEPSTTLEVALFGSVSTEDIALEVRQLLLKDLETSLVRIESRDIQIIGMEAVQDRVKTLGRWEVDIRVSDLTPVRRAIEVVPV